MAQGRDDLHVGQVVVDPTRGLDGMDVVVGKLADRLDAAGGILEQVAIPRQAAMVLAVEEVGVGNLGNEDVGVVQKYVVEPLRTATIRADEQERR